MTNINRMAFLNTKRIRQPNGQTRGIPSAPTQRLIDFRFRCHRLKMPEAQHILLIFPWHRPEICIRIILHPLRMIDLIPPQGHSQVLKPASVTQFRIGAIMDACTVLFNARTASSALL